MPVLGDWVVVVSPQVHVVVDVKRLAPVAERCLPRPNVKSCRLRVTVQCPSLTRRYSSPNHPETGILFSGSTKGIRTTVAPREPHSLSTFRDVPTSLNSMGTHAYPMFFSSRGE